ncbi:retention module-containing protein, partial [Aestuariirhabdus sp. Z084]|uniref:retention module-containing protein n=1 Tax=Aestuariirhabdus haliotis TaxID=2918751 RepID=UPI00201B424F
MSKSPVHLIEQQSVVTSLTGVVYVMQSDGSRILLKAGDTIAPGQLIFTGADSFLELLRHGETVLVSQECVACPVEGEKEILQASNTDVDIEAIQQAILAGADPTTFLEAPAAGEASSDGGNSTIRVERDGAETIATAGFETSFDDSLPPLILRDDQPDESQLGFLQDSNNVGSVDDQPVAVADSITATEDTAFNGDVSGN